MSKRLPEPRLTKILDRVEGLHPQQVLLQRVLSQIFGRDEQGPARRIKSSGEQIELLRGTQFARSLQLTLRIMCMSSMPARVMAADQKDLNPSIGRSARLMAR